MNGSSAGIQFSLINGSIDEKSYQVAVFHRNLIGGHHPQEGSEIAWRVFDAGPGSRHSFTYPSDFHIHVTDTFGLFSAELSCKSGDVFEARLSDKGDSALTLVSNDSGAPLIRVGNTSNNGAINVVLFCGDKKFAQRLGIGCGDAAIFDVGDSISLAVAEKHFVEGEFLLWPVFTTDIFFPAIRSADIIVKEGSVAPVVFSLENMKGALIPAADPIRINFIDRSVFTGSLAAVIIQASHSCIPGRKLNPAAPVVWRLFPNTGRGDPQAFEFSQGMQLSASDSWGNCTPILQATEGRLYGVTGSASNQGIAVAGEASNDKAIQVRNDQHAGTIDMQVYRNGKLSALATGIAPGKTAGFIAEPVIYCGVLAGVEEGQCLLNNPSPSVCWQFLLTGIASMDLVMSGGGTGPDAQAFSFRLENVVRSKVKEGS